jgi:hypothetical protein
VGKILKMPQKADKGNLTLEQIQVVPCPTGRDPIRSEFIDELDRIRDLRKASEK